MRFIKDGKLYDTDKAKKLGAKLTVGVGRSDRRTLYRTERGAFILHVQIDDLLARPREEFHVVDETWARRWAEENLSVDDVCAFWKVEEA